VPTNENGNLSQLIPALMIKIKYDDKLICNYSGGACPIKKKLYDKKSQKVVMLSN
jgi:hypothetical protein